MELRQYIAAAMIKKLSDAGREVPSFQSGHFEDAALDKALDQMVFGAKVIISDINEATKKWQA